jgi:CheY-like chemotaxis protein/anti-sigma regulatory factor (Ser/Thr protein kinase)
MHVALVVDDSVIDRRRAGGLIEKDENWTVAYAEDGESALASIESSCPDVIVTDLAMPGMGGLQLVSAVKQGYPHLPVVIMTSVGSEDVAVQALQQGAASYVPKRRLAVDLVTTLRSVVLASREGRSHADLLVHLSRKTLAYSLPASLPIVLAMASQMQSELAGLWDCEKRELINVGIAIEEALVNAYYHGCLEVNTALRDSDYSAYSELVEHRRLEQPYANRKIHIEATLSHQKGIFVIRDEGPGFDPSQLPDPSDPANLDGACGRGLVLISTFMDAVTHGSRGNEITMVKHRRRRRAP